MANGVGKLGSLHKHAVAKVGESQEDSLNLILNQEYSEEMSNDRSMKDQGRQKSRFAPKVDGSNKSSEVVSH